MRDAYFKELEASKTTASESKADEQDTKPSGKPKLKKRAADEDPFGSDDDGDKEEKKELEKPTKKQVSKTAAKPVKDKTDDFASDDDDSEDDEGRFYADVDSGRDEDSDEDDEDDEDGEDEPDYEALRKEVCRFAFCSLAQV